VKGNYLPKEKIMSFLTKKFKRYAAVWLGLWALLWLVGTAVAAPANSLPTQADDDFVPAVYTFEGPFLPAVLDAAAHTIKICQCESMTTHFVFERLDGVWTWYRLSIYFNGEVPSPSTPEHWERVHFQGTSLPSLLQEAAKYVQNCQCEQYVVNVVYRRSGPSTDAETAIPVHHVYLFIAWPFPDKES
jgi:hypothetical protein